MKLKNKINLFVFSTLAVLSLSIIFTGYLMISRVSYDLYSKQFSRELDNINNEVVDAYQTLESAGILDIEDYVLAGQKDLFLKLQRYKLGLNGHVYIFNNEGEVLFKPEHAAMQIPIKQYLQKLQLIKQQQAEDTKSVHQLVYSVENETFFSTYTKTPVWDWIIIISISENEIFKLRAKYLSYVSLISLAIFLMVFLVSVQLAHVLRKQVDNILDYLRRMGKGEHSLRIPTDKNCNFAEIKSEINLMIAQVEQEIEQRKKTEEHLTLVKEDAEYANQCKSKFLSQMSHELRTPMNAIMGFTQLLNIDLEQPLTASQKENVDEITTASQHLLNLINEILDLAKIESGRIELSIDSIFLGQILSESLKLITPMALERGIKISLLQEDTELSLEQVKHKGFSVWADYTRLKQVLLNLLSNAVKYNNDNGKVIIRCNYMDNKQVRISITDTGPGITPEEQSHLFKSFHRLNNENSSIEGTGIGLAITKNIIELMGGKIGMISEVNKGSTFWFELPSDDTRVVE